MDTQLEFVHSEGIKRKVASGIVFLGVRRIFYQGILTFSNIFLARMLTPADFGSFAIISFLVVSLGLFISFGLTPAIVQRKERLSSNQIKAIFTTKFFSSLLLVVVIYFIAPFIPFVYRGHIDASGVFWLRMYPLYLIFFNSYSISSALLERKLAYKKLVIADVTTLFFTQVFIIFFALRGLGLGSFVLGNVLGSLAGFFIYYFLSPWSIGFHFSIKDIRSFLGFGVNHQANSVIGAINGAVIPLFIGILFGSKEVGLINWAGGIRQTGLAPFEVIERIVFPALSRSQDNTLLMKSLLGKMIEISCMLSFPILAATFALAPSVTYIVYTSQWLPGLTVLYLSLIQGALMIIGAIMMDTLFALGKASVVRNISFFWAIMQWMLTVPLVLLWNFNGVVLAGVLVSATFFIPYWQVKKEVNIHIMPYVLPYATYAVITGIFIFLLQRFIVINSFLTLVAVGLGGAALYWTIVFLFQRDSILSDINMVKELVRRET